MRPIEIYVWNALYWAAYLPISLTVYVVTEQGDVLGILLVGFIMTLLLTAILLFQEGILWEDEFEPAIIIEEPDEEPKPEQVIETTPKEVVKPKRKYTRKPKPEQVKQETLEVKPNEKKENQTNNAAPVVGVEPEPKMRTDVNLDELDTDDDDTAS